MGSKKRKKLKTASAGKPPVTTPARTSLSANPVAYLLITACSFVLYGASINYGYVLDDQIVITKNSFVQEGLAGIGDIFSHDTFLGYFKTEEKLYLLQGGRYRPLSLATFALEHSLFGPGKPGISHFINILLYALTGIVLFRLVQKLLPPQATGWMAYVPPLLISLLWIAHPVHSECVANIKGRDEILALLLSLLSLLGCLRYHQTNRRRWLLLSGILFFAGLLAKENVLTFLAVIPLTLLFFNRASRSDVLKSAVPLGIAALLFIVIRYQALGYFLDHGKAISDLMNDPFVEMTTSQKYATIMYTLGWYLKLLFVPYPLTHDYYPYHVPIKQWGDPAVLVSLALYLGMTIWAIRAVKKRNVYAYCILFFLLTLSIVSNLVVSVGTFMNERFIYMPSVALCLAVGYFLFYQLPRLPALQRLQLKPSLLIAGVITALYVLVTLNRIPVWKDSMSLDAAAVRVSENSARANCFYAVSLYTNRYTKSKDPKEKAGLVDSMEHFINKAIAIYPGYESAYQLKTGILGARYELNRNVDTLLAGFENILNKFPGNNAARDFIDKYVNHLYSVNPARISEFCYRVGYQLFYQQKKDTKNALAFLETGLRHDGNNPNLIKAAAAVYHSSGDIQKAQDLNRRVRM